MMTFATALAVVPSVAYAAGSPVTAVTTATGAAPSLAGPSGKTPSRTVPDLGPNTTVLDPSMTVEQIQAKVDAIAARQVSNEMGPERDAILFEPGTYGTAEKPLNFQVGYYTEVAGLGQDPGDVVVNGSIYVHNQCYDGNCIALNNFWRSMSNLTINVTNPDAGCYTNEFWAVSQAAPLRRVQVNGATTLMDYCTGPSFASGGFIADSKFSQGIVNGSQQQFFVRNSTLNGWSNGVWNQVFSGTDGAPAECFPQSDACGGGPYTTVAKTSVSREKPYPYIDDRGAYRVFVPAAATNTSGVTWADGSTPGRSIPISDFFVAKPTDSAKAINRELARGRNLLLTPGVYHLDQTVKVKRANTIVLGLGLASLTPTRGQVAMSVADVPGVDIAGITFDAGPVNSPVLLQVGSKQRKDDDHGDDHGDDGRGEDGRGHGGKSSAANPTGLQDVFFRIGGPYLGKATVSLEINSDHVVIDDIWAWRADHGNGVGLAEEHRRHRGHRQRRPRHRDRPLRRALPEDRGHLERRVRRRHLPAERDALRPAEPGGVEVLAQPRRLPGPARRPRREALHRHRHGVLQLLQPGHRHLRGERVRGPEDAGRAPARHADDLPRPGQRQGRHPQRRQRRRRVLDDRQPRRARDGRRLPVVRLRPASVVIVPTRPLVEWALSYVAPAPATAWPRVALPVGLPVCPTPRPAGLVREHFRAHPVHR